MKSFKIILKYYKINILKSQGFKVFLNFLVFQICGLKILYIEREGVVFLSVILKYTKVRKNFKIMRFNNIIKLSFKTA